MPEFTFNENLFICIVIFTGLALGVLVVHGLMLSLKLLTMLAKKLKGE
jgi:hypothetical protein